MIRIKDWAKYQHYKTREKNPGWIKLHRRVLDDYDFHKMPVESRALLPMLWLLASENNGDIRENLEEISFRLRLSLDDLNKAIKPLFDNSFIFSIDCLDDVYTESIPEREEESESEGESEQEEEREEEGECPDFKTAVDCYNEVAGKHKLPRCQNLTEPRKKALRARLKEAGGIDGWRTAMELLDRSPFLTGNNDRGWRASFDFVLQAKSFTKLMEGAYEPSHNPKPKKAADYDTRLRNAAAMDMP